MVDLYLLGQARMGKRLERLFVALLDSSIYLNISS